MEHHHHQHAVKTQLDQVTGGDMLGADERWSAQKIKFTRLEREDLYPFLITLSHILY